MKNLFKSLLAFVAGAVIIAACNPEEQPEVPAGTKISVDLTNIANLPARNVPAVTVQVTADGEWLATTPSWITIDPSHATKSTAVTITVADNVDADGNLQGPREGKITLSLVDADVSAEILVAQNGNADLDTRRTYVKVTEITSGKAYLLVAQKAENTYVVPVLFGPTGTYGYPKVKEVTLESDGSIKMEDASYGLIFTDAGRDAAYKIQQPDGRFIWHQGGYNTWSCAADPTEGNLWKLDHVYDDGTVRICDTDAAGVLQYGHGGYDSFAAYGDLDGTSVLPWLYEDTKAAVIDDSKCFFPSTSVKVAADSVKATFAVTANIPWELTKTEGDWITDFTPKSGSADATITVTFPANTADGAEAREAKFHLASTDGKKTSDLTLTQASPAVLTFADIIPTLTAEATTTGAKNALIVAAANKRFILNDGTAYMFAYYSGTDCAAGDKVDISGDAMIYDGCPEWNKPAMSVVSHNNEIKHPEAVAIDEAALAAYEKAPEIKYVEVEVFYDGKNKLVGEHVIYTHAAADVTFEKDKTYKITGYAIGYSSSYKNTSVVVTGCEEVAVEYDQFELQPETAQVDAAAGKTTFKVVAADNVSWTVSVPEDGVISAAVADAADGSLSATGTKDVTVTYPANAGEAPVTYTVAVVAAEGSNVARKTLNFTITQATATISTFAEIIAGGAGEYNAKDALVVAVGSTNTVVYDKTAYMFIFDKNKVSKVGDLVNLSGATTTFNGCPEWNNPAITVASSNNEVVHPEALVLDEAAFEAYTKAPVIEYAVVTGVRDGYNIKVGEKLVNVYANNVRMENGKTYKVYGYTIGYYEKNKQINLVLTSFEEVKPDYAKFELSTTADEVEAAAGAKTFQVVADDAVEWSLSIEPAATITIEGLEPNVFASAGTKNVTINYAANESAAPVNYVVTVATRATVENPTLTYTLTQKGKEGVETLKFEWRNEADTLVNVAFDASDAAHWYVDADPAVEYTFQVLAGNGSVYTESGDGITIENAAGHVAINYVKNTANAQKVWVITATTTNDKVANKTLTAKLVQGPYEYSDLKELNTAIIAGENDVEVTRIINITKPIELTKVEGSNVFAQGKAENFTGGLLLYGTGLEKDTSHGIGWSVTGRIVAVTKVHNGVPEVTKIVSGTETLKWNKTEGYPCQTKTIAELKADYNKFVNVKCNVVCRVMDAFSSSDRNGKVADTSGEINVYVQLKSGITGQVEGANLSQFIVWPTYYNTTQQLGVWADKGTTCASIETSIKMPATLSLAVKATSDLKATTNSPATITYASSDETVATVSAEGVVTAVAVGTATITASVEKDGLYKAATATCEVTVTTEAAPEKKVYTLSFPGGNSKGVSSYTATWSATIDDFSWNLVNFNNNNNAWDVVKCGNKTNASVGEIVTLSAMPEAISVVTVNIAAITAGSVNSMKLYVATDRAFSENLQTIELEKKTGEQELTVPTPTKDCWYKLEFDCAKGSSNGLVSISSVKYAE